MVEWSYFYEFIGLTCFFASIFCRIEWGRWWCRLLLGERFGISGKPLDSFWKRKLVRGTYWAMVESSHFYEFNDLTCLFASIFCRIEWGRRWCRLFLGEIFGMDRNLGSRVILKKKTRSNRYVFWAMVEWSYFYEFSVLTYCFASIFCRIEWVRRWWYFCCGEIFEIDRNQGSHVI